MKFIFIAAIAMTTVGLFSCSKEKDVKENQPLHNYVNDWDVETCEGTLNDYWVSFKIQQGNTGSLFTNKKTPNTPYPIEQFSWSRIEKDSIKIEFAFKAFPNKWELRGLAYDNDQRISGHYYMVDQNSPGQKVYVGAVTLRVD